MSDTDNNANRFEYRFLWDAAEHRRFYRAMQREVRRSSTLQRLLWAWVWVVVGFFTLVMLVAKDKGPALQYFVPLVVFLGFIRIGMPYLSARAYARQHAACIPNDQVRILTPDGLEAKCTTSSAAVQWSGVSKVRETPEFFLFFTTPGCAIQLPKRAVGNVEQLRTWLGPKLAGGRG